MVFNKRNPLRTSFPTLMFLTSNGCRIFLKNSLQALFLVLFAKLFSTNSMLEIRHTLDTKKSDIDGSPAVVLKNFAFNRDPALTTSSSKHFPNIL